MPTNFDKGKKRVTEFIEYRSSLGVIGSGAAADASAHTGVPVEKEMGAVGTVGLFMDDAGDMLSMMFPVPRNLNPTHPIGVRVVFATGSPTAADEVEWIVLFDVITEGSAIAVGSTALDTVIGSQALSGVADALEYSARGVINANAVTEAQMSNNISFFSMLVEAQAFTGITEDVIFLGLAIDYMPKDYLGPTWTQNQGLTDE